MKKAYWIAHVTVCDPAEYDSYRRMNAAIIAPYGARMIVRGGAQQVVEGAARARTVVIEFPDLETAQACYDSAEFQRARVLRLHSSTADVIIVEGCDED